MIDFSFNSCGFIMDDVPQKIFNVLKKESIRAKEKKYSHAEHLVGNIEEEYFIEYENKFEYEEFQNYLLHLIEKYDEKFNYLHTVKCLNKSLPYRLYGLWCNFQKKYEFNPYHNHSGLFSFVIWVNVPYTIDDEHSIPSVKNSQSKKAGLFTFLYPSLKNFIECYDIPVDKSYEGKIILFPSTFGHMVYPFYTSDDYRISISGNIHLIVPD